MSDDAVDWERLSALYDEGSALSGSTRTDWLAQLAGADARLRERLTRMLGGAASSLTALRQAVAAALPETAKLESGQRLGSWALVEPIGEGGMGQVWRARRADGLYEAQAAIKLLRADLGSDELQRRFERERKLLGRLQHPGVAQLLDAGIDPVHGAYLVLELVHGQTLDQHVRRTHATLEQRVRLLLRVAKAVEAAHAQLIVHRDLKPANVLVGTDGFPKLLDFGIATLLDDERGALTRLVGMRLTPAYAAPEQVAGDAISAATDGYSLGVMLYELLTGFLPAGPKASTRTQLEHAVLHCEPPRFAELLTLPERADGPGRPPDARKALGDLEAVCAKALRKEPGERYASVGAFVDDLGRWLDAMPVSVRKEDRSHRARLWFRRNRAVALGGLLVLFTLGAGLATSLWQRQLAQQSARDAEAVSAYLTELLAAASPDKNGGRQPTVVELLDKKRAEVATRFEKQPAVKDRIYETLVETYHSLQRFDVVAPLAEARIAHAKANWGEEDERTEAAIVDLARMHTAIGSSKPVVDLLEPLLQRWDRRFGLMHDGTLNLRYQLLVAYGRLGRLADAEREMALARTANEVVNKDRPFDRMFFVTYEVGVRTAQGRLAEAEALMLATQPQWHTEEPDRKRFLLVLERNLMLAQWRVLRDSPDTAIARAEEFITRANAMMRPGSDMATHLRQQLAGYLQGLGDRTRALDQLRQAQAEAQAAFQTHPIVALPRRIALLEAEVLLAGRGSASASHQAQALFNEMDTAPELSGPRRAEALLALGRVALAPEANAAELAKAIGERLQDPQLGLSHALALQSRIALYQGRLAGDAASMLRGAKARVAYLDSLPEQQGVTDWAARLTLACALRHAGQPDEAALQSAAEARPAALDQGLQSAKHPLDEGRAPVSANPSTCFWDF